MIIVIWISFSYSAFGQRLDPNQSVVGSDTRSESPDEDSLRMQESAALDIGVDRGLFIHTPDRLMQLRILGSVRYLLVYDALEMQQKNLLSTYEIPTGDSRRTLPNYYNALDQTRLGFEVKRKTDAGAIFIRLETDFAGAEGFHIRHAYGQYGTLLVGQTWSLFSQVSTTPATVTAGGPTGSISVRTPQIRYTNAKLLQDFRISLGLEYFRPEYSLPDSLAIESFQLIPDITLRMEKHTGWGRFQFSAIVPMLTGRNDAEEIVLRPGWGAGFSATVDSWAGGKWYLQGSCGKAITRFFPDFMGNGLDLIYNIENQRALLPFTLGSNLSYEHHWTDHLFSSFGYGMQYLETFDFAPEQTYRLGSSFRFNTFWAIVEGSRLGLELIRAYRKDSDKERGNCTRLNLLFYYDF